MTKEQKLDQVYYSVRVILTHGQNSLTEESIDKITAAWMRIPTPKLGGLTPMQALEERFEDVMMYIEELYVQSVINERHPITL